MDNNTPEHPINPPDDGKYILDSNQHEVYEGQAIYDWTDYKTEPGSTIAKPVFLKLCADCLKDKKDEQSLDEWAKLMGAISKKVKFDGGAK